MGERYVGPVIWLDPKGGPTGIQPELQGAIVRGPENLGRIADLAAEYGSRAIGLEGNPAGAEFFAPAARRAGERVLEAMGRPYQPPQTPLQRVREAGGAGVTETAPAMALGPLGPLGRLGTATAEIASGYVSEASRQTAEEAGAGPGGQFAASMAGGMAPGAVGGVLRRGARMVGEATSEAMRRPAARELAAEMVARPVTDRVEAAELLAEEVAKRPYGTRATTAQVLQEAAPGMTRLERSVAAGVPDVERTMGDFRRSNRQMMESAMERRFPGGAPGATPQGYQQALETARRNVDEAYQAVGEMQGIPTVALKREAERIVEEAGSELAYTLPREQLELILRYPDDIPLSQVRRMRTALATRARGAARDPERAQELRALTRLKGSLDETLKGVGRGTNSPQVGALRSAIEQRARMGRLFDRKSLAYKTMVETEDPAKGVARILRSPTPVRELRRIQEAVQDDPQAVAGLRQLVRDQIFGESFEVLESGQKRAMGALRKNRAAFDAVYGEGSSKNAENFLRRLRRITMGSEGTPGASYGTGSAVPKMSQWMRMTAGDIQLAAFDALNSIGRKATMEEARSLVAHAMVDPSIARGLLQEVSPMATDLWARRVNRVLDLSGRSFVGLPTGLEETP